MSKDETWRSLSGFSTGQWNEREFQMKIGIQRSFLNPPNSSVWEISKLMFGRSDYDYLFKTNPEDHPENERFYFRTDTGHWRLKPTWRTFLTPPDRYARIPIYIEPAYTWTKQDGGITRCDYVLYDPQAMQNSFLCNGPVLDNMVRVINAPGMADTRPLSKAVKTHIKTIFLPAMEQGWKEQRNTDAWDMNFLPVTWDEHRQRINDLLDETCHLISGALLHNFQVWLDVWMPFLFNCPVVEELFAAAKEKQKMAGHYHNFVEE